jgi:hypothetical protein
MEKTQITIIVAMVSSTIVNAIVCLYILVLISKGLPKGDYTFLTLRNAEGYECPVRINNTTGKTEMFSPYDGWVERIKR